MVEVRTDKEMLKNLLSAKVQSFLSIEYYVLDIR